MNANGDFAGMPTTPGTFSFTVMVTDAAAKTATGNFSVTVVAGGNFDGPAELPRVTVPSAMSDTPAPGSVITVNAGGDLQSALNSAHCGDTIQLQAGAIGLASASEADDLAGSRPEIRRVLENARQVFAREFGISLTGK